LCEGLVLFLIKFLNIHFLVLVRRNARSGCAPCPSWPERPRRDPNRSAGRQPLHVPLASANRCRAGEAGWRMAPLAAVQARILCARGRKGWQRTGRRPTRFDSCGVPPREGSFSCLAYAPRRKYGATKCCDRKNFGSHARRASSRTSSHSDAVRSAP